MLAGLKCLQSFKMYTQIFMYHCKKLLNSTTQKLFDIKISIMKSIHSNKKLIMVCTYYVV